MGGLHKRCLFLGEGSSTHIDETEQGFLNCR